MKAHLPLLAGALLLVACDRDPPIPEAESSAESSVRLPAPPAGPSTGPSSSVHPSAQVPYMKPSDAELREKLSDMEYQVTQKCGTEPPFQNAFWNHKKPGLYVDVVTGEPLFASVHKFDSGTGWPSFWKPLVQDHVAEFKDRSHGMTRIEVKSKHGGSHLGHVFPDGPNPTGLRYCINSASLRFVPVEDLEREGLGEFASLFEPDPGDE